MTVSASKFLMRVKQIRKKKSQKEQKPAGGAKKKTAPLRPPPLAQGLDPPLVLKFELCYQICFVCVLWRGVIMIVGKAKP